MKILVIRRDNIGDLVCTTPLFRALRQRYPEAWIAALVNSYNEPVLERNPDLDEIFSYTKAKHLPPGQSKWGVYWQRARMLFNLRRKRIDYVIIAGSGHMPRAIRLAKQVRPHHILAYTPGAGSPSRGVDMGMPYQEEASQHEVESNFRLLSLLNITSPPPAASVVPEPTSLAALKQRLSEHAPSARRVVGLHISARKADNRWPADNFVALAKQMNQQEECLFLLLWSPGDEHNPLHPGDDQKAEYIATQLTGSVPIYQHETQKLAELITGLGACDYLVCSDGGAMHLAAAMQTPMVCLFGPTSAQRWHPWKSQHHLLQLDSRKVSDISVNQVAEAMKSLQPQSLSGQ